MTDQVIAGARSAEGKGAARDFALRVALFYGALFLIYGVHVPYLPLWLDWRGLGAGEIAAIMAAPFFLRLLITPVAALIADRHGAHRRIVIALAWASLALALLLSLMHGFWPIFLVAVPFHVACATIMPLTETIAVRGVRSSQLDYGRMRLWGSLTFIAIGLIGGALVDLYGPVASIALLAMGAAATALAAHFLPPDIAPAAHPDRRGVKLIGPDSVRLVSSPLFLIFLFAVSITQAAHATFYAFGALHWRGQGITTAWVGALWAIGVLAEVALFAYSSSVLKRVGAVELIMAGGAAALIRWGVMSLDPPLWVLAPLQLLHALTYGATHLGAMHFIARAVPESAAGTAQALYATMAAGVFMGATTLLSGPLYSSFGGLAYLAPAALGFLGLAAALMLRQRWNGVEMWSSHG